LNGQLSPIFEAHTRLSGQETLFRCNSLPSPCSHEAASEILPWARRMQIQNLKLL